MPSSTKRSIVDRSSVGEPPKKMQKKIETLQFVIYDFKNRKEKRDEKIESPEMKAHGRKWSIDVYPRGETRGETLSSNDTSTDTECISCYLRNSEKDDVFIDASIRCKSYERHFTETVAKGSGWGYERFLQRKKVLKRYLEDDGSFVIGVDIQIATQKKKVWYPKELQQQEVLVDLYQDPSARTSDVIFSVENRSFPVHRSILYLRAKKLFEIGKEYDEDRPISIDSVKGEIFKSVLEFVYTVKTPDIEDIDTAKELLVAADRFDCVHLKLYVESIIVDKFLSAKNAAELLIVGDSYSCALLKEAAMDLFATELETVKQAETWLKVKESNKLLLELFTERLSYVYDATKIDQMNVFRLREELDAACLELDGSREVLVNRLKAHREKTTTNETTDESSDETDDESSDDESSDGEN